MTYFTVNMQVYQSVGWRKITRSPTLLQFKQMINICAGVKHKLTVTFHVESKFDDGFKAFNE
jgi:hypothetical protein